MKRLFVICVILLGLINANISYAQGGVVWCGNCSSEFTQALMNSTSMEQLQELYSQVNEAIQQTAQQMQMVQTGTQQLQNMIKNTTSLPTSMISKAKGMFSQLTSLTQQLNVNRGNASGLDQVFSSIYSGTGSIRNLATASKSLAGSSGATYGQMKDTWADDVWGAQKAAFQESGQQIDDLEKQASDLDSQLDDLLSTPEGQMEAIQSGNQIAAMSLQEAQKLRQLLAVSIQASVKKTTKDANKEAASDAAWKDATGTDAIKNYTPKDDPF
ncbi:MAG: P-type conjugative transfer protein TrbJ [Desulfovibrionaceae bacterium]|nr:P-type conjugative transfer protein TrbJ [Desulfovibrionaceae bacterium]